jgi:hypothetical protein
VSEKKLFFIVLLVLAETVYTDETLGEAGGFMGVTGLGLGERGRCGEAGGGGARGAQK